MATQNPIDLEGTFPLPEAQLDRFLLKIRLGYPSRDEEIEIMQRFQENDPYQTLEAVLQPFDIVELQELRKKTKVAQPVKKYIADLVGATRASEYFQFGASPRGSLGLMRAAQALSAIRGRDYVIPDDIKYLAEPVLAHRLILKDQEKLRGATSAHFLSKILQTIPVPVYEQ
jgi:MoxR-like ATPase